MMGLTPRQLDLLRFIRAYRAIAGVAPTCEEMRVALGLSSKSGVVRLLDGLEERGVIRRMANRARGIELLAAPSVTSASDSTEVRAFRALVHLAKSGGVGPLDFGDACGAILLEHGDALLARMGVRP